MCSEQTKPKLILFEEAEKKPTEIWTEICVEIKTRAKFACKCEWENVSAEWKYIVAKELLGAQNHKPD